MLLIGAAACFLGGCTAAFGPGYSIDKQEIRVHFVPTPDPNILIEADYNLRNSGNQPLDELEIRLPGRRRFHFSNARATWDGASLTIAESPDNDRNELLKLPQAWVISSVHKLHLSVELQSGDNGASGLSFAADAPPPHPNFLFILAVSLLRIASTGSNCDAPYAGTNPEIIPIKKEIVKPKTTFATVKVISIPNASPAKSVMSQIKNNPNAPPVNERKTASLKNCNSIK